jgi:transposase
VVVASDSHLEGQALILGVHQTGSTPTDCLALIDVISPLVARLERDLIARARPDPRVQAPQALPGNGPITAMTLVAEIGDIARFPTARKLCAWAGLTPAVRNSDRKVRHGHITKMGSPWVRFVL